MSADELKALVDHIEADAEAIATKLGKPALVATLKNLKAALESPIVLEGLAMALSFALSKIGLAAAEKPNG